MEVLGGTGMSAGYSVEMDCGSDEIDVIFDVSGEGVGVTSDVLSTGFVFINVVFGLEKLLVVLDDDWLYMLCE